jgi:7,8-dihydro-6-hydroxymethylpterin-pyrophosphokinase
LLLFGISVLVSVCAWVNVIQIIEREREKERGKNWMMRSVGGDLDILYVYVEWEGTRELAIWHTHTHHMQT